MRRNLMPSVLLLSAALLLCASGCGRLAPAGPPAEAKEVERIEDIFAEAVSVGGPENGVEVVEATGTATIKGVLRLRAGDAIPARRVLVINADKNVCQPDGKPVYNKKLLIDESSRGIANALIYLNTKNNTIGWTNIPKPPEVQEVDGDDPANQIDFAQEKCVFLTHVLALRVGQKLNARNLDPVAHNVNGLRGGGGIIPGMGAGLIAPDRKEPAPDKASCNIHPWMLAYVLPRDNGYFFVTDAQGNFEIKNLPAGVPLEFNVWHESSSSQSKRLVLDVERADIPTLDWTKKRRGRFRITLEPDQTVDFGTIDVPLTALTP